MTIWTGIVGLIASLIVATVLNPLFPRLPHGPDETTPADYEVEGSEEPMAVAAEQAHRAT
jgi:hypothetical protein